MVSLSLTSLEQRRALCCPRERAFAQVLRCIRLAMSRAISALIERAARDAVEVLLHPEQRQRRHAGELALTAHPRRLRSSRTASRPVGRESRSRASPARRACSAIEHHPLGAWQPEPRHAALQAAAVEQQAQPGRRHVHLGGRRAEAEVARQREVGRAAVDATVDLGDRHRPRVLHAPANRLEARAGRAQAVVDLWPMLKPLQKCRPSGRSAAAPARSGDAFTFSSWSLKTDEISSSRRFAYPGRRSAIVAMRPSMRSSGGFERSWRRPSVQTVDRHRGLARLPRARGSRPRRPRACAPRPRPRPRARAARRPRRRRRRRSSRRQPQSRRRCSTGSLIQPLAPKSLPVPRMHKPRANTGKPICSSSTPSRTQPSMTRPASPRTLAARRHDLAPVAVLVGAADVHHQHVAGPRHVERTMQPQVVAAGRMHRERGPAARGTPAPPA